MGASQKWDRVHRNVVAKLYRKLLKRPPLNNLRTPRQDLVLGEFRLATAGGPSSTTEGGPTASQPGGPRREGGGGRRNPRPSRTQAIKQTSRGARAPRRLARSGVWYLPNRRQMSAPQQGPLPGHWR